ncbi:hypothetical protein F0562_024750 [Nyssa sinensis]|uniref:Uncharacterized protein n=1 Tax=Nyssa sinensis TaxID=561372 RepID=A0A5J5BGR9_9ASTE|nr:hypothetical protein F0562_024750 [Nyssa sinensis]
MVKWEGWDATIATTTTIAGTSASSDIGGDGDGDGDVSARNGTGNEASSGAGNDGDTDVSSGIVSGADGRSSNTTRIMMMPSLHSLSFYDCPNLEALPQCLVMIPLKKLIIRSRPNIPSFVASPLAPSLFGLEAATIVDILVSEWDHQLSSRRRSITKLLTSANKERIVESLETGIRPTINSYSVEDGLQVDRACKGFEDMKRKHCEPDEYTYTIMIRMEKLYSVILNDLAAEGQLGRLDEFVGQLEGILDTFESRSSYLEGADEFSRFRVKHQRGSTRKEGTSNASEKPFSNHKGPRQLGSIG